MATSTIRDRELYENAIAEQVNGILKETFGLKPFALHKRHNKQLSGQLISKIHIRPHTGINSLTPEQVHQLRGSWKKKIYKVVARLSKKHTY